MLQSLVQPLWNAIVARFDPAGAGGVARAGAAVPLDAGAGSAPPLPSTGAAGVAGVSEAAGVARTNAADTGVPPGLAGTVGGAGAAGIPGTPGTAGAFGLRPGDTSAWSGSSWSGSPWSDRADGTNVVPLLQPMPQLFAALPAPPLDDVVTFRQDVARDSAVALPLDQVAAELSAAVGNDKAGSAEGYSFDFEVPGLGRMEGRVSVQGGLADVQLHVLQPAAATALRQKLSQLQDLVDRETGGDVTLSIV